MWNQVFISLFDIWKNTFFDRLLGCIFQMFILRTTAPSATIKAGLRSVKPRQEHPCSSTANNRCVFQVKTTLWGKNYSYTYINTLKYSKCMQKTHTDTHKRRFGVKCRPRSGVAEWSRFRWKKFFLTSAGCWASAGSYRRGFMPTGQMLRPSHLIIEGKVWKAREREREMRRQ